MPTLRETVDAKIKSLETVKDRCDRAVVLGRLWLQADEGKIKPTWEGISDSEFVPAPQEVQKLLQNANALISEAKTELAKV